MTGFAIVSTTLPIASQARDLARSLVGARLAACVQIVPVQSIYRWQGAIEEADEVLLTCKIAESDFVDVAGAIRALHPYALPEIVMVSISGSDDAYRAWMEAETRRDAVP